MTFTMHAGMGGPHEFVVVIRTNDPGKSEHRFIVRSDWGPR